MVLDIKTGGSRDDPLKPLVNKSIAGLYSPGSTFKPLVALAALEFGTIDPERPINVKVTNILTSFME